MIVTIDQLCKMFPHTSPARLNGYLQPLNDTLARFHIDQPFRVRAFLSQLGHECMEFNRFEENLNYSASGLRATFRKYFTAAQAEQYARKPEAIANRVYANRLGNGNERSGDGWKYRGRGGIQITGKYNYTLFANFMGMTVDQVLRYLETPAGHMMVSGWFWDARGLNRWADGQDMLTITKKINGGTNGYDDRMRLWNHSKSIFTTVGLPPQTIRTANRALKEVNVPVLNVRQGPSTSAALVKQLSQGTKVLVVSIVGDWSQIQLGTLVIGFTVSKYLT
jgi:putative chitinase